jgi:serine/threonine protein kinase
MPESTFDGAAIIAPLSRTVCKGAQEFVAGDSREQRASERWGRVQDLYHRVQECDETHRAIWLEEACAGDEDLRREVESLLGYATEAEHFMEVPAIEETDSGEDSGSLSEGQEVGSYRIVSPLGAGGMGQVYRAKDTRLGRTVAIKVLAREKVADAEQKRRFLHEARAVSALNHPNIVTLHDIASDSNLDFLVMEYVEGRSLDKRIPQRGLPLKEALGYATQIVGALAAAHAVGIVHRDIKPANLIVTEKGLVKVLDFGLAKLTEPSVRDSATKKSVAREGIILGTAAYMSPEQASGKRVDARSDIFAVGVVLYEMLTGRCAFDRGSVLATLGAVMHDEPAPLGTIVKTAPLELVRIVERCLRKDPERRIQTMADLKVALEDLQEAPDERSECKPDRAQPSNKGRRVPAESRITRSVQWLPWSVAAVFALALAVALWGTLATPPSAPQTFRWSLNAESRADLGFDFSADGRRFVYVAKGDPQERLWVRDLNRLEAKPIAGTEHGRRAFFSPDGRWLAFFTQVRGSPLKKVPVDGGTFNTRGAVTTLCDNVHYYGGSWTEDDQIIFSGPSGLMRVAASGGPCEAISKSDPKEGDHRWPQILPGRRAILFTIGIEGAFDSGRIAILNMETGTYRTILDGGARARYVSSGHLVFVRGGQMFAVPFDLDRLETAGAPEMVVESIFHNNAGGFAAYAFTQTGLLLYATPAISKFEWRDRRGMTQPASVPPGVYFREFRLSPDGKRLALEQTGRADIVVVDLDSGGLQRLTSEGMNHKPIWSPDGRAVTFHTLGKGIFQVPLAGGAGFEALLEIEGAGPAAWTPDNTTLLYLAGEPRGIWMLRTPEGGGRGAPQRLLTDTTIRYVDPDLSPNGRWLAYVSAESGLPQVYVQAFPGLGDKVTISKDGGIQPRWSPDGRELFYLAANDEALMVVDVQTNAGFRASPPRVLLPSAGPFDVDPTGERFLVLTSEKPGELHLVTNWFRELREKVPPVN